jgi:hypothetical protein
VSLFNVTDVTYTRKHDKQGNPINARTIRKIFGELPKDPYKTGIGYYIPETIFQLDGNQGERIAFFIELYRLKGQAYLFPEKPVSKKRFDLIRIAGLQETDKTNKTRANELLLETLKQGFELKLIKSYPAKLPVDDDEIIRIYLPYPKNNTTKLVKQYN